MSNFKINTALLTVGNGAISYQAFNALRSFTNLQGVVFSQKAKKVNKLRRIQEYGAWYTGQEIISQLSNYFFRYQIKPSDLLKQNTDWIAWKETHHETAVSQWLIKKKVDLVLVSGFQFILKASFFNQFDYCLNIHPSYLPRYRGPEPIPWGILEDQNLFGITIHNVEQGIDEGKIVLQRSVSRPKLPLFNLIEVALSIELKSMIQTLLSQIENNSVTFTTQPSNGFYLPAPTIANRLNRKSKLI